MVRMHLLYLFDRLRHNLVNLKQQEGVVAQQLPGKVFVFVVVHQVVIMGVEVVPSATS